MDPRELVDLDQIGRYVETVFSGAPSDGSLAVNLRLIGEKGSDKEGKFIRNWFRAYNGAEDLTGWIHDAAIEFADQDVGIFVIPGFVSTSAIEDNRATAKHIDSFMSVCIDIDQGDPDEAVETLTEELGAPTLEVWSGGVTEDGQPKRHLYWRLEGRTLEWDRVGDLREALAKKFGGDPAFGRPTQVIRVPGTIHAKNGKRSLCQIVSDSDTEITLNQLDRYKTEQVASAPSPVNGQGIMNFSAGAGVSTHKSEEVMRAMTTDITEGGTADTNRWSRFSEIAGHYIHQARYGNITVDEARHYTHGWMTAHMVPAWPDERFAREWDALVRTDIRDKGSFPPPQLEKAVEREQITTDLLGRWRIGQYTVDTPPPRRWLVNNLVLAGKRQMIAAAGGAGKSYAMLTLGLMVAAARNVEEPLYWMGHEVNVPETGVVVILSCEDDKEEITRRLHEIDPDGALRQAAADDLIIVPTDNIGGSFPLVSYNKNQMPMRSEPWHGFLTALEQIKAAGKHVALVVIDTLNATLHGEENSAQIASEYISAVSPIVGEIGAALMITHHSRKGGHGEAMTSENVRGSNAFINAMRNVIGVYQSPDWETILPLIGRPAIENDLFELAVVKGNVSELTRDKRYLVRSDVGFLVDVTGTVLQALANAEAKREIKDEEREAWLCFAIGWAAEQGVPYRMIGNDGLYARAASLPRIVTGDNPSAVTIQELARRLRERGKIVSVPLVMNAATGKPFKDALDVPDGALASKRRDSIDTSKPFTMPEWGKFSYDAERGRVDYASNVGLRGRLFPTSPEKTNA